MRWTLHMSWVPLPSIIGVADKKKHEGLTRLPSKTNTNLIVLYFYISIPVFKREFK